MFKNLLVLTLALVMFCGVIVDSMPSARAAEVYELLESVSANKHRSDPYRDPALGDNDVYDNVDNVSDENFYFQGPWPVMQPKVRGDKWMTKYYDGSNYDEIRRAQKGNRNYNIPSLPKGTTIAQLQDLTYRMSKQLISATQKLGVKYTWVFDTEYLIWDYEIEHPNGVGHLSHRLTCLRHYPCLLSGGKVNEGLTVRAGYNGEFKSWRDMKEAFLRMHGYLRYLGGWAVVMPRGTENSTAAIEMSTYLYPLDTKAPFELVVTIPTNIARDDVPRIYFLIYSPFIPSATNGRENPQRMPKVIVH